MIANSITNPIRVVTCAVCGTHFVYLAMGGRNREVCSKRCHNRRDYVTHVVNQERKERRASAREGAAA